jgi:DNA-binding transcriptional ArsR family regulator
LTTKRRRRPRLPRQEAATIRDLEQIKLLADPLRLRMLEAFCQERTTKQVAELLGEKPTRLYHHVEALERVGLIELARTRPNRGTVEKYYLAVARSFRADARAFRPGGAAGAEENAAFRSMIATIFDTTAAELSSLADRAGGAAEAVEAIEEEALLSFLEIRASRAQLDELRGKLQEILDALAADEEAAEEGIAPEAYRLTLAFYPLAEPSNRPARKKAR